MTAALAYRVGLLMLVGAGVKHYTGHLCIAVAVVAALAYLKRIDRG